jgi:hypothetical protein
MHIDLGISGNFALSTVGTRLHASQERALSFNIWEFFVGRCRFRSRAGIVLGYCIFHLGNLLWASVDTELHASRVSRSKRNAAGDPEQWILGALEPRERIASVSAS